MVFAVTESVVVPGNSRPFGIISSPVGKTKKTAFVILNSGILHRVGPSRMYVALSRSLAELGFGVARIDISGKGDSPRRDVANAAESLLADYDSIAEYLSNKFDFEQFVVLGLCSGADDAMAIAASRDNVCGMVMLDGFATRNLRYFINHYSDRFLRIAPWLRLPKRVLKALLQRSGLAEIDPAQLRMRDVRNFPSVAEASESFSAMSTHLHACLCVYTAASQSYYNYAGQLSDCFHSLQPQTGLEERYMPSAKHTFPLSHHRAQVIDYICEWSSAFE